MNSIWDWVKTKWLQLYCLVLATGLAFDYGAAYFYGNGVYGGDYSGFPIVQCIIFVSIPLALVLWAFFYLFAKNYSKIIAITCRPYRLKSIISLSFSRKNIILACCFIVVAWIPWIHYCYPCYADWDSIWQLFQFATPGSVSYGPMGYDQVYDAWFIDHKPVFTSLVYGLFWEIGILLGDQQYGIWLYTVVLTGITAASLAVCICYLDKLNAPWLVRALCLLFAMAMPIFPRNAVTMQNDMLFAPAFAVYFMCYIEFFRCKTLQTEFPHAIWIIAFMVSASFCILTKKSGSYIVLFSALVLVLAIPKKRAAIAALALLPYFVFVLVLPALLYPALGIIPGGRQEALSIPFQQVVSLYVEEPDCFTQKEIETIDETISLADAAKDFKPMIADPVKRHFNQAATDQEVVSFLRVWALLGIQHPLSYLATDFKVVGPLLAPTQIYELPSMSCSFCEPELAEYEGEAEIDLSSPPLLEKMTQLMNRGYDSMARSPIGFVFASGLYGGWIPIIVATVFFYRTRRFFWVLTPMLGSFVVLLISPLAVDRYTYPFIIIVPLLIGVTVFVLEEGKKPQGEIRPTQQE